MLDDLYRCFVIDHDLSLVLLAAAICAFACFTSVSLILRAESESRISRTRWLLLTALAAGVGIWATHFIAMLAYDVGLPKSYDLVPTILSVLIAIFLTGLGFATFLASTAKTHLYAGATIVGIGIGAMHYTGMASLRIWGNIAFDPVWIAISFLTGIGGTILALSLYRKFEGPKQQIYTAVALTLAICALHFTGMTALTVEANPTIGIREGEVSDSVLAIFVTLAAFLILTLSLIGATVDRHLAERRSQESRRLRGLANAALEGIVLLDGEGKIVDANYSFLGLCGRHLATLKGMSFTVCFQNLKFGIGLRSAGYVSDAVLIGTEAREIPTEIFFRPVPDHPEAQMVAIVRDIRERHAAEQRIDYLSSHDNVTGLANRMLVPDRLAHSFALARKSENKVALHFIDIDAFKELNARLGHSGGDEILKAVAGRIKEAAREVDLVARLSADQFCIIQEDIESGEGADFLALKVRQTLARPVEMQGEEFHITACTGIALFPEDADDPEDLMLRAEIAMKRAKSEGHDQYHFFEHAIDEKLEERRKLKQDLKGAIQRGELFLVYQPQFIAGDEALVGFEVLLRWKHPEKGMISPAEFIPMAEETGVINDISVWLLSEACREAASWEVPVSIAVNLSPIQFLEDGLVNMVQRKLHKYGLAPDRLEFEITEGVLIADGDRALEILNQLKSLGIRLAMDDFGTGYSSLSYLQDFPFDKLKIDRSFVMQMADSKHSAGIVKGVIGLAHGLGIPVLAEGVETTTQLEMLKASRCDEVQGFLLGRPERIEAYARDVGRGKSYSGQSA
ncbi:bifunctional diguanylate cyclase/phosphodiesterase [Kordiimonas aestuarii]|uniref:bifunctional diguanylate cyclase/phosphodiesterase n=1 Tax=Kordiimonas aestuarii TaxID=1005925 RepID=UPI0021CE073B|nr:EAL domain-containing protein [Kordiimonas aestuarii]